MRHILIDYARRRSAAKRGGGRPDLPLDAVAELRPSGARWSAAEAEALFALDAALERLESRSEREARIVEMKFFGGLTIEEIAAALDLSPATVKRGWSMAQAWLYREMTNETRG